VSKILALPFEVLESLTELRSIDHDKIVTVTPLHVVKGRVDALDLKSKAWVLNTAQRLLAAHVRMHKSAALREALALYKKSEKAKRAKANSTASKVRAETSARAKSSALVEGKPRATESSKGPVRKRRLKKIEELLQEIAHINLDDLTPEQKKRLAIVEKRQKAVERVRRRSKLPGGGDALDHAISGGGFESNRRRH
jgi:hypothetical protein